MNALWSWFLASPEGHVCLAIATMCAASLVAFVFDRARDFWQGYLSGFVIDDRSDQLTDLDQRDRARR